MTTPTACLASLADTKSRPKYSDPPLTVAAAHPLTRARVVNCSPLQAFCSPSPVSFPFPLSFPIPPTLLCWPPFLFDGAHSRSSQPRPASAQSTTANNDLPTKKANLPNIGALFVPALSDHPQAWPSSRSTTAVRNNPAPHHLCIRTSLPTRCCCCPASALSRTCRLPCPSPQPTPRRRLGQSETRRSMIRVR